MARKDTIWNALVRAGEEIADGNGREANAAMNDIDTATDSEWESELGYGGRGGSIFGHGYSDAIE
jgi:hypothetical protein